MGVAIAAFLNFLTEHMDLVMAVYDAIDGGMQKDDILKAIRQAQIDATDAAVKADLGPKP